MLESVEFEFTIGIGVFFSPQQDQGRSTPIGPFPAKIRLILIDTIFGNSVLQLKEHKRHFKLSWSAGKTKNLSANGICEID